MPPINFQDIFNSLKQGIADLATTTVSNFAAQAKSDGLDFLNSSKDDLQKWSNQLAQGQMNKDEFIDLLEGQKDLLKLIALKQAGLAEIALDNFKSGVFSLIQKTILAAI
ncbi:MAG TPA: hypothetical protein VGM31_06765 [Puia sp.]|jgi:hypothetical protein